MRTAEEFKSYEGKLVAVQMRSPIFIMAYGGPWPKDELQYCMVPALTKTKSEVGEKVVAVGFAHLIPAALIEVRDSRVVLKTTETQSGAEIEIDVPPDEILYVWRVAKAPSSLITPG